MDRERISSMLLILGICWSCGALFFGIGVWSAGRKKPVTFYSGTKIDSKIISDIPAYNRDVSGMWKRYSIPFWFAGVFGMFGVFQIWVVIACMVCIILACTFGIGWLIREYERIKKKYIVKS